MRAYKGMISIGLAFLIRNSTSILFTLPVYVPSIYLNLTSFLLQRRKIRAIMHDNPPNLTHPFVFGGGGYHGSIPISLWITWVAFGTNQAVFSKFKEFIFC